MKKMISWVLCLLVVLCMIPTASAYTPSIVYIGGVGEQSDSDPTYWYYTSSDRSSFTATTTLPVGYFEGYGYAKWDNTNSTLTLNNFKYEGASEKAIELKIDATIISLGTSNSIMNTCSSGNASYGIYANSMSTITGTAPLKITTADISSNTDVTTKAIWAMGIIFDGCDIEAIAGDAYADGKVESYAIYGFFGIGINNSANIVATAGQASTMSSDAATSGGILCVLGISLQSGTVTASGNIASSGDMNAAASVGVWSDNLTINEGVLEAWTSDTRNASISSPVVGAIYFSSSINVGSLTIKAGNSPNPTEEITTASATSMAWKYLTIGEVSTPTPTPSVSYDYYVPSGHTVSSDLIGINAVVVDNKLVDPKYYTIVGTNVILTDEFLKTLKDGKHSIRLENATHVAKGTFIVGNEVIRKGDTGDSVKTLQTLLNSLGFNCGDVDGIFGSKTDAAVKKYQTEKAIAVDGIVGSQTWGKLGK